MRSGIKYVILAAFLMALTPGCNKSKTDKDKTKESQKIAGEKKDQYRMAEIFQDNKSQIIDLIEGPATFDIEYKGNSTFTARLLNNEGDLVDILADVTGPYKATKSISVPKTSSYILDVRTTGPWSVYRK